MSQVREFEDRRWSRGAQTLQWRHEAALELTAEEPVLDIGGGDGLFLDLLRARRGFTRLSLLDISPVAVERARERQIDARVFDVGGPLPFESGSFGTACALDLLEHLYEPEPVLAEMARVARSLVLTVPNFNYWKDRLRVVLGQVPFECKPRRGHVHWFSWSTLGAMVQRAGLEIETVRFSGIRRLGALGAGLASARPSLFADSFALRLRRR